MTVTLGYWSIRGIVEPIKYLLEILKVTYKFEPYTLSKRPDGSWDRSAWTDKKFNMQLPLPNLPYLVDGDVKLTQSKAILRYLCLKHNPAYLGKSVEDQAKVEMVLGAIGDVYSRFSDMCYSPQSQFDEKKSVFLEAHFAAFEKNLVDFMKQDYVIGDYVTIADIVLFEFLDVVQLLYPGSVKGKLEALHKRIASIPELKAYRESDRFHQHPVNNLSASWK